MCNEFDSSLNAFRAFNFVSDYAGLRRVGRNLLGWRAELDEMTGLLALVGRPGCEPARADAVAEYVAKVDGMLPRIETDLAAFDTRNTQQAVSLMRDRLGPLTDMMADLAQAGETDLRGRLEALIGEQFGRIRTGAYLACRRDESQALQQELLVREIGDAGVQPLSPYEATDLREDIAYCGFTLDWRVEDANQAVLSNGSLGGGGFPAEVVRRDVLPVPPAITVVLTGNMRPLICPPPLSQNNERLVVTAERVDQIGAPPGELASLTAPGNLQYLEANPLSVSAAQLRSAAGVDSTEPATVRVRLTRSGEVCAGVFQGFEHQPLVELDIAFPNLQIVGPTLPDGRVGTAYSTTLVAIGGTEALAWSVVEGSLPSGLSLSQAGVIAGTPSTEGTFPFSIRVQSGAQADTAQASIQIFVNPEGAYDGFLMNIEEGSPPDVDSSAARVWVLPINETEWCFFERAPGSARPLPGEFEQCGISSSDYRGAFSGSGFTATTTGLDGTINGVVVGKVLNYSTPLRGDFRRAFEGTRVAVP